MVPNRRPHALRLLTNGGYDFAHDPNVPIVRQPALWLPEYFPGTLILQSAPPDLATTRMLDLSALGAAITITADANGQEIVVKDVSGELHIRLQDDGAPQRPVFLMPLDALFELRLDVALRLVRRLRGQCISLLPSILSLTGSQKMRYVHLLHAFDIHKAGGGPRDVAAIVLRSKQASLPSSEWKDSHARRTANRLIHDSIALVESKYLQLLRGG
nr:DUF2285 domain-containing protein [uncultured Acidocella sp.]